MAGFDVHVSLANAIKRFFSVIRIEKKEVSAIYFYAILSGLIQLSLPLGIQAIINFSQVAAGRTELPVSMWLLIFLVVGGVFVVGVVQVNQMKVVEKIQQRIFTRYAFEFTYKIPKFKVKEVDDYHLPELVNRFFDTVSLQKGLSNLLLDIPLAVIQVIFGLILLSLYSPLFVLLGLLLIIILYLVLYLTAKKGLDASLRESDFKYSVASWIEELARTFKSFKVGGKQNLHLKKTDDLVVGYLESRTHHFDVLKFQYWSLIVFKLLITATMLIVGAVLLIEQQLNVGQFIAAEIVIITVLAAVEKLILSLDKAYDVLTSLEKLSKVTDRELEENGTLVFDEKQNGVNIQLANLSFGFTPEKKVLQHINLDIKVGDKVCITGDVASGKSVLLELFTGAFPVTDGTMLVNGIPIGNYDIESYRKQLGVFYHEQDIFYGSLYDNITMGDTSIKHSHLMELSRVVGLTNYIEMLPKGFNTVLHPTGKGMSSIIAKKILLLRAFASSPKLLLLDEPFEIAGGENFEAITNYLLSLQDTTIIVVTGDRNFASKSDLVVQMEKGQIAGMVSHR
jgi:ABC-type bacteriocin/lantibiotic exporter with double-glycine peptidase domain